MPSPSWIRTEEWIRLHLGSEVVPGVSLVTCSGGSGIDTRKPRGGKKARQQDIGAPPIKVHVETEMSEDEWRQFEARIIPMLRPPNAFAARDPLAIAHPEVKAWGVGIVIPGEFNSPPPSRGGTKKVSYTLEEYAPPTELRDKGASKPKDEDGDAWNVQPMIERARASRLAPEFL